MPPEVNRPEVVADITAVFERYEAALVVNDVDTLDELVTPEFVLYGGERVGRPSQPGREDLRVAVGEVVETSLA
jgi:hypothetical protein